MNKKMLTTSLTLGLIAAILSAGVFFVNDLTQKTIADSEEKQLYENFENIFPGEEYEVLYEGPSDEKDEAILLVATASKGGDIQGYLYLVAVSGYSSKVTTLVGINADEGAVVKAIVTKQSETPGLGTRAAEPEFLNQFEKRLASEELKVKDNITPVAGATISSNAVAGGINSAFADFTANYGK